MMRTQKIDFPTRQLPGVFPTQLTDLGQALAELHLNKSHPVIVLIGAEIDGPQADATRQAIQTISRIAHDGTALVICGAGIWESWLKLARSTRKEAIPFPWSVSSLRGWSQPGKGTRVLIQVPAELVTSP